MTLSCPICTIHGDPVQREMYEIRRDAMWVLRHHPFPAPLPGWLLLDSLRHCPGPLAFNDQEAENWGSAVRDASRLVKELTGCDRVYAICFGEGAQHLHLHLIPRFITNDSTAAWSIADLYRAVASGDRSPVEAEKVTAIVQRARKLIRP